MTDTRTHEAIENAAKNLPDGFRIEIVIEKDSGSVSLLDPEGNDHDFPSNRECLTDEIKDATEHAIEMEKSIDREERDSRIKWE